MTITPTVHLNGTSRRSLVANYRAALEALSNAKLMLQEAAPHGRDYYPQGDAAIQTALDQHQGRIAEIDAIMGEIRTIYQSVLEQAFPGNG